MSVDSRSIIKLRPPPWMRNCNVCHRLSSRSAGTRASALERGVVRDT